MRIHACPACGSRDLRPATVADGAYAGGGELLFSVCQQCGERGQPLVFDDKESFRAFRAGLKGEKRPKPVAAGLSTRGDILDRWTSNDVLARLVGLSAAGFGILFVIAGALVLAEGGLAGIGSVLVGLVAVGVGYLFLRREPRLEPSRRLGIRRRVARPSWVAPLVILFGGWWTYTALEAIVRGLGDYVGGVAALGPGLLFAAFGTVLGVAIVLWGVGAWRDHRALRTVPRHLR